MYTLKKGSVKVTQSNLDHVNHVVNESVHQFDNDDLNNKESSLVRTLKEANTNTSQIKRMLGAGTNKQMSTQRVRNLIAKNNKKKNKKN